MLINGKFVKEEPPKIGRFYIPQARHDTPEERFAQSLLLGWTSEKESILSKFFGLMLRM